MKPALRRLPGSRCRNNLALLGYEIHKNDLIIPARTWDKIRGIRHHEDHLLSVSRHGDHPASHHFGVENLALVGAPRDHLGHRLGHISAVNQARPSIHHKSPIV